MPSKNGAIEVLDSVSNDGAEAISASAPYIARITIEGTSPLLFHRWSVEGVEEQQAAPKGSKAKKTDNVDSYVWRDDRGHLCLPGEYVRQATIHAAKYRQDPRSPRKSAMDLYKAGIVSLTDAASLGTKDWDYLDRRRVVVQRSAITRTRPAFREGWRATVEFMVMLPEYIDRHALQDVISQAGKLVGVGDFRPSYGRFVITKFEVV